MKERNTATASAIEYAKGARHEGTQPTACRTRVLETRAGSVSVPMTAHEHAMDAVPELIRLEALFGSEQSIDPGERFGANGSHLTHEVAAGCCELINVGIGLACLNGLVQSLPVLLELLPDGLRGVA